MLQAFVITLREGLEAFLIVAISLAYLRKSGRRELVPAVHWGIALSVLISIGAAFLFRSAANHSLWEGALAVVAAVSVASLTVHMWRTGEAHQEAKSKGTSRCQRARRGRAAFVGVFLFTMLMITREGNGDGALMGTLLFQQMPMSIVTGAVVGTLSAAVVAWLWSRYGHRVNLALFFQVTAVFLLVFVVQLLIYGFHELTEANIFPYSEPLHWATEPYGPDGQYGQYLTYLLVMLPLGWLAISADAAQARRDDASRSRRPIIGRCPASRSGTDRRPFATTHVPSTGHAALPSCLMIEAHTSDAWTRPAAKQTIARFRDAIVLGGFAAPLFLCLAGLALVLSATQTAERTGSLAPPPSTRLPAAASRFSFSPFCSAHRRSSSVRAWADRSLFRVDILERHGAGNRACGTGRGLARTTTARVALLATRRSGDRRC